MEKTLDDVTTIPTNGVAQPLPNAVTRENNQLAPTNNNGAMDGTGSTPPTPTGLTREESQSAAITGVISLLLFILAVWSYKHPGHLVLALSVGALGGLVHEFAQSGGKVLFFQRQQDGLYLGSLTGVLLGAVAGFLAIKSLLIAGTATGKEMQIVYDVFLAGVGLKGVVEAAVGTPVNNAAGSSDANPKKTSTTALAGGKLN